MGGGREGGGGAGGGGGFCALGEKKGEGYNIIFHDSVSC